MVIERIQHVVLFMADGPQDCIKDDHAPCGICGGASFTLTSVVTGGTWDCYTHVYDHPEEAAPKGCQKITSLAEYKAKKANIPEKG